MMSTATAASRLAGSESVLNGGLYISVDGVKIDGLKVVGGAMNAGNSSRDLCRS